MKIKDPSLDPGVQLSRIQKRKPHDKASSTSDPGISKSKDRIELSEGTRYLLELKDELASINDVRTDLIQDIKKAVEEGRYSVDSGKVADKLLMDSLSRASEG